MVYEKGTVNEYLEPTIIIEFEIGKKLEFLIDTGFNGSLCVPRSLMNDLGLIKVSEDEVSGVGSHTEVLDISEAEIYWFDEQIGVDVLINEGSDRLLGSELLHNKTLTINYKDKTVTISD